MAENITDSKNVVHFLRKRDYQFVRQLGQGGCGRTLLLRDDYIDELFVCKKYAPFAEAHRQPLFTAFVKEIKLLHQLHHRNVVRVFNHYLYPEAFAGYILMEFVDGLTVDKSVEQFPERTNEVFLQAISGFAYLEKTGILHRDIRPGNLMVCDDGTVKIIDLGFGKEVRISKDFAKSISLNWPYEPPLEFGDGRYDFKSEVYFVGKLFEKLIGDNGISQFKYSPILGRMCQRSPDARIPSFADVERQIGSDQFVHIDFTQWEEKAYRQFAAAVLRQITKVDNGAKYVSDAGRVATTLNDQYRTFMLESEVPDCAGVLRCLIEGQFYYKKQGLGVNYVKDFTQLLKSCGDERARVVLANLHTRFDTLPRYSQEQRFKEDDIPF